MGGPFRAPATMARVPPVLVRRLLTLLTAAFVLGGAAFALGTPLFQNPDEPSHIDLTHRYAHDPFRLAGPSLRIREGTVAAVEDVGLAARAGDISYDEVPAERPRYRSLDEYPRADEPATSGCPARCQNYQYGHPPGWYLAMAPLIRFADSLSVASLMLLVRWANVLLAAAAVPLTWYTTRQVWPGSVRRATVATAVVAFSGPYLATAAAVNNDAAVLLLGAATTALMARLLRQGVDLGRAALLGAVVGIGLLVKAQFLVFAPVAGLTVLVAPALVPRWKAAMSFAVPAIIGAHWWLATLVRGGSLTPSGSELIAEPRPGPWEDETFVMYVLGHLGDVYRRIFGLYGWASVEVPELGRVVLALGTGGVILAWLASRRWARPEPQTLRWLLLAVVPVGLLVASYKASFDVYQVNGEVRGLAPRYLYPALPVVAVGLSAVGRTIADRLPRHVIEHTVPALVAGLAVIGGGGSFLLAVTGLYDSTSITELLDRASRTSPVSAPGGWLLLLGVGWAATVAAVVSLTGRLSAGAVRRASRSALDDADGLRSVAVPVARHGHPARRPVASHRVG